MANRNVPRDPDLPALLDALDESQLTDEEVARAAGIYPTTIKHWRNGYTANPFHTTMAKVAAVLGLKWTLLRSNERSNNVIQLPRRRRTY